MIKNIKNEILIEPLYQIEYKNGSIFNILDFDKCTKCKEGYELGNYDLCYEIENNE